MYKNTFYTKLYLQYINIYVLTHGMFMKYLYLCTYIYFLKFRTHKAPEQKREEMNNEY